MTLSPATIGDETPLGAATFHFTFLSGPSSVGGCCSSATLEPPGPRNCGHGEGPAANELAANIKRTRPNPMSSLISHSWTITYSQLTLSVVLLRWKSVVQMGSPITLAAALTSQPQRIHAGGRNMH